MTTKVYLTSEEFKTMTLALARKIQAIKQKFVYTVGIERGGVYVSHPISRYLLSEHHQIKISFYSDSNSLNSLPIYDFHNIDFKHIKKTRQFPFLLLDDLLDTGSSLNWFINHTGLQQGKHFYFGCLYHTPANKFGLTPDFWVSEKRESDWIVFPHEVEREAAYAHKELVVS